MTTDHVRAVGRRGILAGLAGASVVSGAARAQGRPRDTLVFGLENYPPNLHPFQHTGSASGSVKLLTNRGLLSYDASGALRPELAESWNLDSPTLLTFRLRANARFQNGMQVTSDDVKYSFTLLAGDATARMSGAFAIIEAIETPDPLTVRIRLKQPSSPFPQVLANVNCAVISAKAHAADPTKFVSAGPYRITAMERGSSIDLAAVSDFYRPGRPKLPKIRVVAYIDDSLRAAALEAGDADIIEDVPWESIDEIAHNQRLAVQTVNGPFMFLVFNTTTGPFANPKVRSAVGHAINRVDLLKAVFAGKGAPLDGIPIPADSPFYDAGSAHLWPRDLDRARALLKEAGHANGFSASLLTTTSPKIHTDASVVVQQSLAEIGIQVTLRTTDWGTRVALGNRGQYEFAMNGTALDYNDPDSLAVLLGTNPPTYQRSAGFSSARIDAILARGRSEEDPAERRRIYAELSRQVGEEAPMVFINWRAQSYGLRASVRGFHNLPGFLTFHSAITIEDVDFAA